MKKVIALVLVVIMCMAVFTACGGEKTDSNPSSNPPQDAAGTPSGIDYESTDVQEVSSDMADCATLADVVENWLGGNTMFIPGQDQGAYTYEDFVEKIGVEATTYNKDESGRRVYTWVASDDSTSKLAVCFEESGGQWLLSAIGSTNLI